MATCSLADRVRDVRDQLGSSWFGMLVVLNADGVVLGRLNHHVLDEAQADIEVAQVMYEGPTTVRPSEELAPLTERMRRAEIDGGLVTRSDGRLLGILSNATWPNALSRRTTMLIGELADRVGVNPKTIRYYESIGLLPEPARTSSGYRDYGPGDVERLAFVRRATELDLQLDEIAEILALRERVERPCDYVLDAARRHVDDLEQRIAKIDRRVTSCGASWKAPATSPTTTTATASSSNTTRPLASHRRQRDRRHDLHRRHRHHRPSRGPVSHRERTGTVGTHTGRRRWLEMLRRWTVLALVAFALNMLWELVQLPLYVDHEQLKTSVLYLAAIDDAGLILAAAFAAGFAHRRSRAAAWTVLLLGLFATAAVIELRAVTTGRWAYAELMPTVGIVGLSPLLQLPLTGALAVTLARPWHR